jgi:large subunit ribosomal protein L29
MKAKDLRERSGDDLKELEKSLAKDVFTARFKNFTNRLDDTSAIKKTRRDLARVKTLLREQTINATSKGEATAEAKAPAKKAAPKKKAAAKTAKKSAAKKEAK